MDFCKCGHGKFLHFKANGQYTECLALLGDGQNVDFCSCEKYEEVEA